MLCTSVSKDTWYYRFFGLDARTGTTDTVCHLVHRIISDVNNKSFTNCYTALFACNYGGTELPIRCDRASE